MRSRISIFVSLALLCMAFSFALPSAVSAASPCVRFTENANNDGDYILRCSSTPTTMKIANLSGYTVGLHNGCESVTAWPGTRSDWNDCISYVKITDLPPGYRVVLYVNSNYGFRNHCFDANGDSSLNLNNAENDRTSSFRVEAGSC